jgi:exosortase K
MVSVAFGSTSEFKIGEGFVHAGLNIAIDKSCSGFNFWLLCSGLLLTAGMQVGGQFWSRWWLLSVPMVAYGLTVVVNASRIITAVSLNRALPELGRRYTWLHQAEGAMVYLFFLRLW